MSEQQPTKTSPVTALIRRNTTESLIPSEGEWAVMRQQAEILRQSGFLPAHLKSAEQVLAVMITGRDLRIPATTAVRNLFVVQGRVSMSADLMLALAYGRIPGFRFGVIESTADVATVFSQRPNGPEVRTTFTIKDAGRAGLTIGDNWRKYPAQMLLARAKAGNLRLTAPDALAGIFTPEELGNTELNPPGTPTLAPGNDTVYPTEATIDVTYVELPQTTKEEEPK